MAHDLYQQLKSIEELCRIRRLTARETDALLKLCPYAFANHFPDRDVSGRPADGRVLSTPWQMPIPPAPAASSALGD